MSIEKECALAYPVARVLVLVVLVFLAIPAAGSMTVATEPSLEYVGPAAHTISEALQARERSMSLLHATKEGPSDIVFFYGAAHAQGLNGAFFRTDIYLNSAGLPSDSGRIYFTLYVLPGGTEGNQLVGGEEWTIPPGGFGIIEDVVGRARLSGAATVVLLIDHTKSTAPSRVRYISGWGRTYTAGSNGGEYSTTLPVTAGWLISSTSWVAVTGVQQNLDRRTNVSVFNHSTVTTVTPNVYVFGADGQHLGTFPIRVPPLTSVQVSLSNYSIPAPGGSLRIAMSSGQATAFAVTVDNATNDGDAKLLSWREY